jgi:thioredoxin-like negative regulator of GroEL
MTAAHDFNYKVALASGLRDLQSGRLRPAEEQFRYLVAHFPTAAGGYRGLAKVFVELEDRAGALTTLRDGAASLAKAADRVGAIALLKEAVILGPMDVAVHRRLAAALGLAGDHAAAIAEHRRFAHAAVHAGDRDTATREIRYALGSSGDDPALVTVAVECGLPVHGISEARQPAAPQPDQRPDPGPEEPVSSWAPAPATPSAPSERPSSLFAAPPRRVEPEPAPPPPVQTERSDESADERAARYIAARDPRAAQVALVAAREFLAAGQTHAASDLLLQVIAAGLADHQAQRLLVEVATSIGKKDVARAKCALLAEALRLDGQAELAVEVERLAQAV